MSGSASVKAIVSRLNVPSNESSNATGRPVLPPKPSKCEGPLIKCTKRLVVSNCQSSNEVADLPSCSVKDKLKLFGAAVEVSTDVKSTVDRVHKQSLRNKLAGTEKSAPSYRKPSPELSQQLTSKPPFMNNLPTSVSNHAERELNFGSARGCSVPSAEVGSVPSLQSTTVISSRDSAASCTPPNFKPSRHDVLSNSTPSLHSQNGQCQKKIVPSRPPPPPLVAKPKVSDTVPCAVVLYDFEREEKDELQSKAEDIVNLKCVVNDEWMMGVNRRTGQLGIIPRSYIDVKVPLPPTAVAKHRPPPPPPKLVSEIAKDKTGPPVSFALRVPCSVDSCPLVKPSPPKKNEQPHLQKSTTPIRPMQPAPFLYDEPPCDEDGVSFSEGPRVYSVYDYKSDTVGDLAFFTGEIIRLISRVNDDWMEGESSDGRRGIFPSNFVEVIEDLPPQINNASTPLNSADCNRNSFSPAAKANGVMHSNCEENISVNGCESLGDVATAVYGFTGEQDTDLQFQVGDKILVLSRIDADWLYGERLDGTKGVFPANFIDFVPQHLESHKSTPATPSTVQFSSWQGQVVVALYDYFPEAKSDLYFEAGDRIMVEREVNADWLEGCIILELTTKRKLPSALFPKSFVQLESELIDTNNNR